MPDATETVSPLVAWYLEMHAKFVVLWKERDAVRLRLAELDKELARKETRDHDQLAEAFLVADAAGRLSAVDRAAINAAWGRDPVGPLVDPAPPQ